MFILTLTLTIAGLSLIRIIRVYLEKKVEKNYKVVYI